MQAWYVTVTFTMNREFPGNRQLAYGKRWSFNSIGGKCPDPEISRLTVFTANHCDTYCLLFRTFTMTPPSCFIYNNYRVTEKQLWPVNLYAPNLPVKREKCWNNQQRFCRREDERIQPLSGLHLMTKRERDNKLLISCYFCCFR